MKLYCTPGGTWAGSEATYKAAMKAEGSDPKAQDRKQIEVPVSKAELMEWLTFHNVNPINPQRNAGVRTNTPAISSTTIPNAPISDLEAAFNAAPIEQQLKLATLAIGEAEMRLTS